MAKMKRRDFLQQAIEVLAVLGLTETGWLQLGDRYYQALAQPSPRKLALLVGINQYPVSALNGCLTDVELQRQLLIHRFGFQPVDVLTLSDQQASRQQIEAAFLEHLIEQSQPGDLVVFHFSGYGRSIQLQTGDVLNSLIPVDGVPTSGILAVNDLLETTLSLLLRSLPTNRVITILDTSYSAASQDLQGNLRIRTRPRIQGQLSIQASEFQTQLLDRQGEVDQFLNRQLPGIILTAAGSSQPATETQWSGFSAGLFTYALTQSLWAATASVQVSFSRVGGMVKQLGGKQQPSLSLHQAGVDVIPETTIGADGVVISVGDDGKTAQIWLAGLPLPVLEYYAPHSLLAIVTSLVGDYHLQVRSRTGLTAKAQISGNGAVKVGQFVREAVRVLPRSINLTIALDTGLERIERVDATSAFAVIPRVSSVIAGESADYLFGRVTNDVPTSGSSSRYGLFSISQELIPNTAGEMGEAVKVAVQRLAPKLQTLLAAKLWRLTTNETASSLRVRAALELINNKEQILIQQQTFAAKKSLESKANEEDILNVPIGSRIQYRIENDGDRPVYVLLLSLDNNKNAIAFYPTVEISQAVTSETLLEVVIPAGGSLNLPQSTSDFAWTVRAPIGVVETQLIFSCTSFSQTMAALGRATHPKIQEPIELTLNPVEVAQAVLQDLHQASAVKIDSNTSTDIYALDVNTWASLSFIYQVV